MYVCSVSVYRLCQYKVDTSRYIIDRASPVVTVPNISQIFASDQLYSNIIVVCCKETAGMIQTNNSAVKQE